MKKLFIIGLLVSSLFGKDAFLMNQKYICIYQASFIGDKIVQLIPKKEIYDYPIRFYVDDNNVLHTDGEEDLKLLHIEKTVYGNNEKIMMLNVEDGKRFLLLTITKPQVVFSQYFCIETDQWTLR